MICFDRKFFYGLLFFGVFTVLAISEEKKTFRDYFLNEELIVSNFPEKIAEPGIIFKKKLGEKPLRVVYYHQNNFDKDIYVNLLVSNKGKKTSKLKYVKSSIEASFDEVYVGYRATKDYFADLLNGQEQTLFLKSGHSESLVLSRLKPGQICGGIVRLDKEKYSELDLKMQVLDAEYPSLMDVDKVHNYTFAFFPTSYKTIDIQYDFKGIKEITIGGYPFFEDTLNKIILKGNYGVLYKVGIFLNNESNEYKNLSLVFSPSSGIIKGVMILNKGILETEFFQGQYHNNLEEFYKEIIAPGEQKKIEFYIMPQAGSFYPINIVLNNNKEIKYNY